MLVGQPGLGLHCLRVRQTAVAHVRQHETIGGNNLPHFFAVGAAAAAQVNLETERPLVRVCGVRDGLRLLLLRQLARILEVRRSHKLVFLVLLAFKIVPGFLAGFFGRDDRFQLRDALLGLLEMAGQLPDSVVPRLYFAGEHPSRLHRAGPLPAKDEVDSFDGLDRARARWALNFFKFHWVTCDRVTHRSFSIFECLLLI